MNPSLRGQPQVSSLLASGTGLLVASGSSRTEWDHRSQTTGFVALTTHAIKSSILQKAQSIVTRLIMNVILAIDEVHAVLQKTLDCGPGIGGLNLVYEPNLYKTGKCVTLLIQLENIS